MYRWKLIIFKVSKTRWTYCHLIWHYVDAYTNYGCRCSQGDRKTNILISRQLCEVHSYMNKDRVKKQRAKIMSLWHGIVYSRRFLKWHPLWFNAKQCSMFLNTCSTKTKLLTNLKQYFMLFEHILTWTISGTTQHLNHFRRQISRTGRSLTELDEHFRLMTNATIVRIILEHCHIDLSWQFCWSLGTY